MQHCAYPVLNLAVADGVVDAVACHCQPCCACARLCNGWCLPGPLAAANASSPIKKSKSSVPLFAERCPPGPAPPVKNEGLLATAGLPEPEPPAPPTGPLVAMAVGKTNEGESLPAKPGRWG